MNKVFYIFTVCMINSYFVYSEKHYLPKKYETYGFYEKRCKGSEEILSPDEFYYAMYSNFEYLALPSIDGKEYHDYQYYVNQHEQYCKSMYKSKDEFNREMVVYNIEKITQTFFECFEASKLETFSNGAISTEIINSCWVQYYIKMNNLVENKDEPNIINNINKCLNKKLSPIQKNLFLVCLKNLTNQLTIEKQSCSGRGSPKVFRTDALQNISREKLIGPNVKDNYQEKTTVFFESFDFIPVLGKILVDPAKDMLIHHSTSSQIFKVLMGFDPMIPKDIDDPQNICTKELKLIDQNKFYKIITNYIGLPNSYDTTYNIFKKRMIFIVSFMKKTYVKNEKLYEQIYNDLISEDYFSKMNELLPIENEEYLIYMMRCIMKGYIPLYRELWQAKYSLLYSSSSMDDDNLLDK